MSHPVTRRREQKEFDTIFEKADPELGNRFGAVGVLCVCVCVYFSVCVCVF